MNPDKGAAGKLSFAWPHGGQTFSFDLGGRLRYGDFDGQLFFAEVKKHSTDSNLRQGYRDFLAKCYVAYQQKPEFTDHFMWVSWTPHSSTKWASHTTGAAVRKAVLQHADRVFPADIDPEGGVDDAVCEAVAERLWLLILSDKQERLVPAVEHLGLIHAHEMKKASGE